MLCPDMFGKYVERILTAVRRASEGAKAMTFSRSMAESGFDARIRDIRRCNRYIAERAAVEKSIVEIAAARVFVARAAKRTSFGVILGDDPCIDRTP